MNDLDYVLCYLPAKERDAILLLAYHMALAYRYDEQGKVILAQRRWSTYREVVRNTQATPAMTERAHRIACSKSIKDLPFDELYDKLIKALARTGAQRMAAVVVPFRG